MSETMGNCFSCFVSNVNPESDATMSKTGSFGKLSSGSNLTLVSNKLSLPNIISLKSQAFLKEFVETSLKRLPVLDRGQRMKITKLGQPIDQFPIPYILTNAEVRNIHKNTEFSESVRLIMGVPFSEISRITDNIFLTGIGGLTIENCQNLRINIIVNVTYQYSLIIRPDIISIRIPVEDDPNDDIHIYFNDLSDFLSEATIQNWRIVIHCEAGASRSTALVLAYLIKWHNLSLKDAFDYVHTARECARPNMGFFEKLIKFEKLFRPYSGTHMIEFVDRGVTVKVPNFYRTDYPDLCQIEINKQLNEYNAIHSAKTQSKIKITSNKLNNSKLTNQIKGKSFNKKKNFKQKTSLNKKMIKRPFTSKRNISTPNSTSIHNS